MFGTATAQSLAGGVALLANSVIHHSENFYYAYAAHRQVVPNETVPETERHIVFFRGMTGFELAPAYLETLRSRGCSPTVYRSSSPDQERNHLRSCRDIAVEAVRHLVDDKTFLDKDRIFVGHSAGGFPTYILAAMAKGADLAGLKASLPALQDIPQTDLEDLAKRLRRSRFIALSSPLNGVRLSRLGRVLNRWVLEPVAPQLVTGLTRESLQKVYRSLGVTPGQVLDGNIVSKDNPLVFAGGPASWASHAAIQGGMRLFSRFLNHPTANDGIVPMDAALLNGPLLMVIVSDHLKLVESTEAAHVLVDLVEKIEKSGSTSGDGVGEARSA